MVQWSTNKWLDPPVVKRSGEVEGEVRRRQNSDIKAALPSALS